MTTVAARWLQMVTWFVIFGTSLESHTSYYELTQIDQSTPSNEAFDNASIANRGIEGDG